MFKVGDTGKTRGGLDYRVICVNALGNDPIVALVNNSVSQEWPHNYKANGSYRDKDISDFDLIKEPVREVRYGGVYASMEDECLYKVAAAAVSTDGYGYSDRVFEITFEDGKPVEARIVFVGDGK